MNAPRLMKAARGALACVSLGPLLALSGCSSDGYSSGGVSTSVGVAYGYGGYYGPYFGDGYYDPYPPSSSTGRTSVRTGRTRASVRRRCRPM